MRIDGSPIRILNELTEFDLTRFNDRLRLQKLLFLARKLGFDAGFSFDWYLRGPYSPSLTRMLFSAQDQDQLHPTEFTLTANERSIVDRLTTLLGEDIENHQVLELLASVWYHIRRRGYSEAESQALIDEIHRKKPQYSRSQVEQAFQRIIRYRAG